MALMPNIPSVEVIFGAGEWKNAKRYFRLKTKNWLKANLRL